MVKVADGRRATLRADSETLPRRFDHESWVIIANGLPPAVTTTTGLNVQPQPSVVFKLQYQYTQLGDTSRQEVLRGTLHQLDAQAAWAF